MIPPTRGRGREQPEPDLVHAELIARVQHEHRPRRAERDVEREDREGERPHRRGADEPADALAHLRAAGPGRLGRRASGARAVSSRWCTHDAGHERPRPKAKHAALAANGSAIPIDEQERADRWRDELVRGRKAPCSRALAMPEVLARHDARQQAAARRVGERLGRAQDEQDAKDERRCSRCPSTIVAARNPSEHERAAEVDDDDDAAPVHPVRGGAGHRHRTAAAAGTARSSASETRNGSLRLRCDRAAGPAASAIPSPMLLMTDGRAAASGSSVRASPARSVRSARSWQAGCYAPAAGC